MAGISQSLLAMVEGGQRTLSKKLIPRVWNAMSRVQQAYRDAVSLDVLIRLEESELLVTERWSKQGAGDADAVVTSLASLKPKAGE